MSSFSLPTSDASEADRHRATRVVRLPASWTLDKLDFQANYYNYLAARLIPSTDVFVGERLAYRSNALGCRGNDLQPGPVLAVIGDDFVHGDAAGGFVSHLAFPGCQALNGGIENLTLEQTADRLAELCAQAPVAAALVVAPMRPPRGDLDLEQWWPQQLDRLQGPPLIAFLRHPALTLSHQPSITGNTTGEGLDDNAYAERFNAVLDVHCARTGRLLIEAPPPAEPTPWLGRLFGAKAAPSRDQQIADAVGSTLAGPLARALLDARQNAPGAQPSAPAVARHGSEDVGRIYPLW